MAREVNRFAGAGSLLSEIDSTSTGVTLVTGYGRDSQPYVFEMNASSENIDLTLTKYAASNGLGTILGFAIHFPDTVPTSTTVCYYDQASGALSMEIKLDGTGKLQFTEGDTGGYSVLATTASALVADTWYYVEAYWERETASGAWAFFLDDVEVGSGTGADFRSTGGATTRIRFFSGNTTRKGFTDIYLASGCTSKSDRLGKDTKVVYYWSTQASATSSTGVNLNTGTWAAVWDDVPAASQQASITGTGDARRLADTGTHGVYTGPYNEYGSLTNIHGYKANIRCNRGTGAGSTHNVAIGGTTSYVTVTTIALTTTVTNYETQHNDGAGDPGIGTGRIGTGFGTNGAQDINVHSVQVCCIYGPGPSSVPRTVTCSPEVVSFTENNATVVRAVPRVVTCSSEVVSFTENNATVQLNYKRIIGGATTTKKSGKGIHQQIVPFDGSLYTLNTVANALDSDTGTYVSATWEGTGGDTFQLARGISAQFRTDDINEKPFLVQVRAYVSNTSTVKFWAGYEDGTNLDFTGAPNDGWYLSRGLTYIGSASSAGGDWSSWMSVVTGDTWWANPETANITEPLSWSAIKDHLTIGFSGDTNSTGRVHAIEVRVSSAVSVLRTGYFNGTVGQGTGWATTSNLTDSSTTTWTSKSTAGADESVRVTGNTLTQGDASDVIYGVYVRARCRLTWTGANYAEVALALQTPSLNVLGPIDELVVHQGNIASVSNPNLMDNLRFMAVATTGDEFWTPWFSINLADVDWGTQLNWTDLAGLLAQIRRNASWNNEGSEVAASKIEIAVLAAPNEANRLGGNARKDRGVVCTPEVLSFTETQSTVDRTRGVNGAPEVLTFTENNAVVSFATSRTVTGLTQAIAFTENNASLNVTRGVIGQTEVLTFAENNATVTFNYPRVVTGVTEVAVMAGTLADVHAFVDRILECNPEVLSFTENNASLNVTRGVLSATEVLTVVSINTNVNNRRVVAGQVELTVLPAAAATINVTRGVLGATEVLILPANNATVLVSAPRNVTGVTEVITIAASANVNVARGVSGTPEALLLTENNANLNVARGVLGATEVLILPANNASLNVARGVLGATEVLAVVSVNTNVNNRRVVAGQVELAIFPAAAATVNVARGVLGVTEVLQTSSSATVAANRGVISATEVLLLADNDASLNIVRGVLGVTEVVTFDETAANLNITRNVSGVTEILVMAGTTANVQRSANRDITATTATMVLTENAATVDAARGVVGATEALLLTENNATVNVARVAQCAIEALLLAGTQAIVNVTRYTLSSTEVLAFTSTGAVNTTRGVVGATEVLLLADNDSTVDTSSSNNPRTVNCTTEVLVIANLAAVVNQVRGVVSGTEQLVLSSTGNQVNVSRTVNSNVEVLSLNSAGTNVGLNRTIAGATEVLILAGNNAQVFLGTNRYVTGGTEILAVSTPAAQLAIARGVLGVTEGVTLTSTGSVAKVRPVVGATQANALTTSTATVGRSRAIIATIVANLATTPNATVFRGENLTITGITAVNAITSPVAAIRFPRRVNCITQGLVLATPPALVSLPKNVQAATSVILFDATQGGISKLPANIQPGSLIYARPAQVSYVLAGNRMIRT